MEENKPVIPTPGKPLPLEQVNEVAGGDGSCPSTVTVGTNGILIQNTSTSVGDALIGTYDGLVDATSHVIETVANAVK